MVRAFHDAGIKVFLDVVYNHTGEGDVDRLTASTGSILSWRGLDNPTYYELRDDDAPYEGRLAHPLAANGYTPTTMASAPTTTRPTPSCANLMIDSLKHWSDEMGVDGFRFDLAAVLGNSQTHGDFSFDNTRPDGFLIRAVSDLPAARPTARAST